MSNAASYYLLDVFTDTRYGGNQLAIFPEGQFVRKPLMARIARELQLSETVFIEPASKKDNHFKMKIFTPAMELPTAGHPTIGAAFFMVRHINFDEDTPTLNLLIEQKVGTIRASVELNAGAPVFSNMIMPKPEYITTFNERAPFAEMLGLKEDALVEHLPIEVISCGVPFTFIPIKSKSCIEKIQLDLNKWQELKDRLGVSFLYAFTRETTRPHSHVHGRMFAPEAGITEDAATGAANGPLGCYLYKHRLLPHHSDNLEIISEQGFEMGRPSIIQINVRAQSGKVIEVKIGGNCVLVGQGQIYLE
ncbi:MAG: PhzF family phenazine biosynthesis protein [Bacteroidota bacterium]